MNGIKYPHWLSQSCFVAEAPELIQLHSVLFPTLESVQPARHEDKYISPSDPHTGSNEEVEQDMLMLHSDIKDGNNADDEVDVDVGTPT